MPSMDEMVRRVKISAKELAAQKEGLSWWQRYLAEITKVSMTEGGMDPRSIDASLAVTAARQRIAQGTGSNLAVNNNELASWQKLSDSAHGAATEIQAVADKTKTVADLLKDATQDTNLFNTRMAALGNAATIDEQRQQRLKAIDVDRLKNQFSLVGSENDLLAARARSAANLDAAMKTEALRIGHLGELASVEEIVAQKQKDIAKAISDGARFSDQEIAAMREKARIQAEQAKPENQIATERQMLFLSQEEGAIRQKLIGWGIDFDSVRGQSLAQEMRINDVIKTGSEFLSGGISSIAKDAAAGVTATDALINAFKKLDDMLIDILAKKIATQALGSVFGGLTETGTQTAAATTAGSAGQLTQFDLQAAVERNAIPKTGGIFGFGAKQNPAEISALDRAQAAERLKLINDFNALALAADQQADADRLAAQQKAIDDQAAIAKADADRALSYQDRLFTATNDTTPVEGELGSFDRLAA
jgi:hypothetical protein